MSLCKASPSDPEPVRGQIAVSLMSRDAHTAGGSDRLPPTAVVDRMGNVSCFGVLDNPRPNIALVASTSTPAVVSTSPPRRESQAQPTPNSSRPESLVVTQQGLSPCDSSIGGPPPPGIISTHSQHPTPSTPSSSSQQMLQPSASSLSGNQRSSSSNSNGVNGVAGLNIINGSGNAPPPSSRRKARRSAPPTAVPIVELPAGFETRITEQGQVYFYQLSTGTSSWYHPGLKDLPSSQTMGNSLPHGWEQRLTPSG